MLPADSFTGRFSSSLSTSSSSSITLLFACGKLFLLDFFVPEN